MLISAFRYLRAAWSPPPYVSSLRTHHYHHHPHHHHLLHHPQHQQDSVDDTSSSSSSSPSMETLLEPIRYSMAFLTLFSILSTVIIAIILVPFGPLQLLAQLISLVVSLSGLVGTFRRSIVLSSVYALSMLLFLFLQCSYFFVLLKLVQEVNGLTAAAGVNSDSNFDKSFPYHTSSSFPYNSVASSSFDNTSPVRGFEHYPSPYTLPGENEQQNFRPAELSYQPSISSSSFDDQPPPDQHSLTSAYAYAYPRPRPMHPGRHISEMLNEELAYLSLLTVPMLAWLPPSLFMESVAVLLLTMQAIAGACFLYALRRSQAYYQQQQEQHQNYFAYSRGGANKLDIEHQASLLQALDPP